MHPTPLKWFEMQVGTAGTASHPGRRREMHLRRENLRLMEENERLRNRCADLAASAELWIRLYEAALHRVEPRDDRVSVSGPRQ